MVPCPTSSLPCRYLTRPVEACAHCIWRAGCGKAAVEPFQLALHPPPPIRYNASLCTTRCRAQLPVPDQIYWLGSDPVVLWVCRMLQTNFGGFTFPDVGCIACSGAVFLRATQPQGVDQRLKVGDLQVGLGLRWRGSPEAPPWRPAGGPKRSPAPSAWLKRGRGRGSQPRAVSSRAPTRSSPGPARSS